MLLVGREVAPQQRLPHPGGHSAAPSRGKVSNIRAHSSIG
jgi:hypothetical protein